MCMASAWLVSANMYIDEIYATAKDFPTCYRESALVCLKTGTMSAALSDFVAVLREEAGELVVKDRKSEHGSHPS